MGAERDRGVGMAGLVLLHLLDDCTGALVLGRQALKMPLEMRLDLALGLRQKAEVPAIAELPHEYTDGE